MNYIRQARLKSTTWWRKLRGLEDCYHNHESLWHGDRCEGEEAVITTTMNLRGRYRLTTRGGRYGAVWFAIVWSARLQPYRHWLWGTTAHIEWRLLCWQGMWKLQQQQKSSSRGLPCQLLWECENPQIRLEGRLHFSKGWWRPKWPKDVQILSCSPFRTSKPNF